MHWANFTAYHGHAVLVFSCIRILQMLMNVRRILTTVTQLPWTARTVQVVIHAHVNMATRCPTQVASVSWHLLIKTAPLSRIE